jgi:hypothetical protein
MTLENRNHAMRTNLRCLITALLFTAAAASPSVALADDAAPADDAAASSA